MYKAKRTHHCRPQNKIKALEAKLQALDAEKAASDASRNASASISEGEGTPSPETGELTTGGSSEAPAPIASTSTLPGATSLPSKPLGSLPKKPDSNTITQGEKEQRAHKAEAEQKQNQRPDQRYHDNRRDRNKKPQEVPKSTLASLGAGMGR